LRELRKLKGASEQVLQNRELLDLLLPTLRADLAVCENYQYRPEDAFDCPIAAFGGLEDSAVSREDHAAWIAQTRCSFSLHMFPGDHFFLHSAKEGLLSALFQQLQTLLCVEGAGQLAHDQILLYSRNQLVRSRHIFGRAEYQNDGENPNDCRQRSTHGYTWVKSREKEATRM